MATRTGRLKEVCFAEAYGDIKVEYRIEYSAISNISRHFGIMRLGETNARIAEPERSLLDWLHVRRPSEYLLRSWVEEMDLEGLDLEKLKDFSSRYPKRVKRSVNQILQLYKHLRELEMQ